MITGSEDSMPKRRHIRNLYSPILLTRNCGCVPSPPDDLTECLVARLICSLGGYFTHRVPWTFMT